MADTVLVKNFKYGSRFLNFYCLVDENERPIFAPCLFLFQTAISGQDLDTSKAYAFDLKSFFNILSQSSGKSKEDHLDFRDVSDAQMDGYLNGYLLFQKKLSTNSVQRHITTLRTFYEFSYKYGLLEKSNSYSFEIDSSENKTTMLEQATQTFHQMYITEDEFDEILLSNITTSDPFLRERDEIALKLGYYAGLRTEELVINDNLSLVKLRKQLPKVTKNIPQAFYLTIKGKNGVTRKTLVDVKVTKAIHKFIWGRLKATNSTLMCQKSGKPLKDVNHGTALFRRSIEQYLNNNALEAEDVKAWLKRSYHVLRKCYATNSVSFCYESNLDPRIFVSRWLGHASSETTEDYIIFEALLNKRLELLTELNLENSTFATAYKNKFNKK
ncbi:tyrosine-type recombinase/integrase [Pseudoalteromonas sp. G24-MNA-CIBAN-0072]|uniref:tyrosine-type recombinase/integrase n=1 Tax=Pseudoalteromonas sp. G24-MNA-CIBAN-0072 TaxID=3140418 RepID=UPI0033268932